MMKFIHKRRPLLHLYHRARNWFDLDLYDVTRVITGSTRAYGIDMSHWEDSFNPDLAAPGLIDFALFKATEGTGWLDDRFLNYYQASLNKINVLGAWHYLRSQWDGIQQAKWFLDVTENMKLDIIGLDFENINNTMDDKFVAKAQDFGNYVKSALPACKLLFYTNPSTYDNVVYPGAMRLWGEDVFTKSPWDGFWVAQYWLNPGPDKYPGMPKNRSDWAIYQYSETGNPDLHGTGGWVDQDVFNGTPDQLYQWIGDGTTPPPPPPPALDIHVTEVLPGEVASVELIETGKCLTLASVSGYDKLFNVSGFNIDNCLPNMWRRIDGVDHGGKPNPWDPILWWEAGRFHVDRLDVLGNAPVAAQLKRFVIIGGKKNPAANPDWDNQAAAWNIAAEGVDGKFFLFTVMDPCTLNQAVDGILAKGYPILRAGDLDSGRSTMFKDGTVSWSATGDSVGNLMAIKIQTNGGGSMPKYQARVSTPFWRVLPDLTVKGDDGTVPKGTQFDVNKTFTHSNKQYMRIAGDLNLSGWNVTTRYDYCVFADDVELTTAPPPPPPPTGATKTHTVEVFDDGSIAIDGKPYL